MKPNEFRFHQMQFNIGTKINKYKYIAKIFMWVVGLNIFFLPLLVLINISNISICIHFTYVLTQSNAFERKRIRKIQSLTVKQMSSRSRGKYNLHFYSIKQSIFVIFFWTICCSWIFNLNSFSLN